MSQSGGGWSGGAAAGGASSGGNATGKPAAGGHAGGGGPHGFNFAAFAARTEANLDQVRYFAAAVCGLMAIFILFHTVRSAAHRLKISNKPLFKPLHVVSRLSRRVLMPHFPALPSRGHAVLAFVFFAINVVLLFTNMDNKTLAIQSNIASRTGWLAMANMILTVFLSLKNTPLSFLTPYSYERLNILHQLAGYATVVHVILHACTYASYFSLIHNQKKLRTNEEIFGMVSGFGMLFLALSAAVVRRFWYELFYVMHIFFFIVTVVFVGLHQPEVAEKVAIVTIIAGALWVCDRIFRGLRICYYAINNEISIEPLPHGATRITLKKGPRGQAGGSHVFLWVPGIRLFETHPFTLASAKEHEFVVASYDGFTKALHNAAVKNPGRKLRASVEGPYGKFPDPLRFDRIVMLAGGSGGSYTFGTVEGFLDHWKGGENKIAFHWMVKERAYLQWFSKFITRFSSSGHVQFNLHITNESPPSTPDRDIEKADKNSSSEPSSPTSDNNNLLKSDPEKPPISPVSAVQHVENTLHNIASMSSMNSEVNNIENPIHVPFSQPEHLVRCPGNCGVHELCTMRGPGHPKIFEGRPSVGQIIRDEIAKAGKEERVLVIACGPGGLMKEARDATASCVKVGGPGVELHCEQFEW